MMIYLFNRSADYERENIFIVEAENDMEAIFRFAKHCKWGYLVNRDSDIEELRQQLDEESITMQSVEFDENGVLFDNAANYRSGGKVKSLSNKTVTLAGLFDSTKTSEILKDTKLSF